MTVTHTAEGARERSASYFQLVLLGAVIGVPAAFAAAGFMALVHEIEHLLWPSSPAWYLVLGLPVVGAAVVLAARTLLPGDGGHPPLLGMGGGLPRIAHAPGIVLAAIGTLGFGAVLGPEAPLIALGSIVGLAIGRFAPLTEKEEAVVGSAGSFAAISSLFGGPLVGGVLMVEGGLGMGAALLPVLIPGFVAAAIGYVVFIGLGNWGGIASQPIAVPGLPPYHGTHVLDLLSAIAVGIVVAVVIVTIRGIATRLAGAPQLPFAARLLGGGLAVGALAELGVAFGANAKDVLFSGQASVAVVGHSSTKILLVLLAAKGLGYAVSLGCGFRGGPIFPAIFLGVAVAGLAHDWLGVSSTLAVSVGASAGIAATTRLILTPLVFSTLLVGTQGLDAVPAAVLATVAAWLTVRSLDRVTPEG